MPALTQLQPVSEGIKFVRTDQRALLFWASPYPSPYLDVRTLAEGFETRSDAECEKSKRIQLLIRGNAQDKKFAKILQRCRRGRFCYSPACPVCSRRFRIWLGAEILALIDNITCPVMLTLIPPNSLISSGKLKTVNARRFLDRFRQQLWRCGYRGPAIGGLHGSYEGERDEYQLHAHFIASGLDTTYLDKLRRFFPDTVTGSAGLVIKPITSRPSATTYCFKAYWPMRVRFLGRNGRMQSQERRLKPAQANEWMVWQGQREFAELMFLYGVRRRGFRLTLLRSSNEVTPHRSAMDAGNSQ